MRDATVFHVTSNDLFANEQHGFVPMLNTLLVALES